MRVGEVKTLDPKITPENANSYNLTWYSSDESIVSVSSGIVIAKGLGEADIEVSFGEIYATIRIIVVPSSYEVSFNPDNGSSIITQNIAHNELVGEITNPEKEGYTFSGWYDGDVEFDLTTKITASYSLKAKWLANPNTSYQVKHYVLNLDTNEFDLLDTENLTAPTDSLVRANIKTIEGRMAEQDIYEARVLADGSLVIEVYYLEYKFTIKYELNGGNFTYLTREEMVEDFISDYNMFGSTKYTLETLPMGAWANIDFHTFLFDARFRDKWLWLPHYLSEVGSTTNKPACSYIIIAESASQFNGRNDNWKYALAYEIRGFMASRKYVENANWMSADYSDFDLANGFWKVFARQREKLEYKNLTELTFLEPTAYRDGYLFEGWYLDADLSGEAVYFVENEATLYAKWKIDRPVTEINITLLPDEMEKYSTFQLNIEVLPNNAYNKNLSYKTSDDKILSISDKGLITAKNSGTATVILEAVHGEAVKTVTITVLAQDSLDIRFIEEDFNGTLKLGDELNLKLTGFGAYSDASANFTSVDPATISVTSSGLIKALALGIGRVEISVDGVVVATVSLNVIEEATSNRLDSLLALLIANNEAVVDTVNASLYYDDHSSFQQYYKSTYGSVNFYLFDNMNIDRTTYLVTSADGPGKFGGKKASTEFITVHDTANISGGLINHGKYWKNPETSTSIHFTVGDYGVLQNLDTAYVAYHAGDGTSTTFTYNDTGIKANGNLNPEIDISSEGYFTFNGVASSIIAPKDYDNKILDKSYFTYLGPNWKIGENGNYYLGKTWFVTSQVARGVIASYGGNNNSTGIEMCVNTDGDIYDTWQRTAKLVATLLEDHNLGFDRVVQHNTFTGKNCPQSIFGTSYAEGVNYWDRFMKFVIVEYEILTNYSDATITFTSHDTNLLSNTGRVIGRPTTTTTVSYTITVTIGGESKSITLSSIIPGISTWSQYDGFFATR